MVDNGVAMSHSNKDLPLSEQINRQIDAELTRARKTHAAYFRGGESAHALPAREKLPPPVLILRRQGTSRQYPLIGFIRPCNGDHLAFQDIDQAAELARANKYTLRIELDKPVGYPLPSRNVTEVSAEQVALWEASQAEKTEKAEPAAA